MINQLRHFLLSQKLFFVFSASFAGYLVVLYLEHFINNPVFAIMRIIGGLFLLIFGLGINSTLIIQWIFRRRFDQFEFLSLSLLNGILIAPAILILDFVIFKKTYDWHPIANILAFLIIAGILLFFKKTSFPVISIPKKSFWKHPFFIVFIFGLVFTLIQTLLYNALPDLDPYRWLMKYANQYANQQLDTLGRSFFCAFVFIGTRITGLSIFLFFKYIIPFIFLSVLFPAWMVARDFKNFKKQLVFLLFVFASPVLILYTETPMPQSLLITLAYFFIFFLFYALEKKDNLFLCIAGVSIFLSFFYHQAGSIIFLIWLLIFLFAKRAFIFLNKKTFLLLLLLAVINMRFFEKIWQFLSSWIFSIIPSFFASNNLNLFYPAYYINVDRNSMGWGSSIGVMKFYAFHMGPLLGSVLTLFLLMLLFNKSFRSFFMEKIAKNIAVLIILVIFIIFFTIAEIFPRFPNISLLPDRAWVFCGIFAFVFLYILLHFVKKISNRMVCFFMLLFLINISGALYINYLKRYLITPAQLESAEWIKSKLPQNRIFLSFGHKNLLPIHANSPLVRIPIDLYCSKDIQVFNNIMADSDFNNAQNNFIKRQYNFLKSTNTTIKNDFQNFLESKEVVYSQKSTDFRSIGSKKNESVIINPIDISSIAASSSSDSIEDISFFEGKKLYVYYSRQHQKNPYRGRPYKMITWGAESCPDGEFLFDLYPDKFKRVYQSDDKEVIIWQVLKD